MEQITPDILEAIASRIDEAASEYREVAQKMRNKNLTELSVTGFDTLQKATLPRLESPVNSARRALKTAISSQLNAAAKRDVEAATQQLETKRKKGKKP